MESSTDVDLLSAGPDAAQGFESTYILVFLILGVVLIVAFILWETRFPFPLMPMNVWRDREFCLVCHLQKPIDDHVCLLKPVRSWWFWCLASSSFRR
jgi:hypothetical protein